MKTHVVPIDDSRGARIPKTLLGFCYIRYEDCPLIPENLDLDLGDWK